MAFIRFVTGLMLLMSVVAQAETSFKSVINEVDLTSRDSGLLGEHLVYLEDPGAELKLDSALVDNGWQKGLAETPNLGFTTSAYWFALQLKNSSDQDTSRLLEIGYPILDYIDVYVLNDGNLISTVETGDLRPISSRPIEHRNFLFPIDLSAQASTVIVLRVQTEGSLQLPLALWETEIFIEQDGYPLAMQFLFAGIMLSIGLYNLLVWFSIRDSVYLWYVLNVITITLVQMSLHGVTALYLWPGSPSLNNIALVACISLNISFVALFTYQFLNVQNYGRLARSFIKGIVGLGFIILVYSFFASYSQSIKLAVLSIVVAAPGVLVLGLYAWRKGDPLARIFTYAWSILLIGHFLMAFNKMGIIPRTVLFEYGPQIGAAIEVLLLSFALAYRIKLERQKREQVQLELLEAERRNSETNQRLLQIQQEANEVLEDRVKERTAELEDANEKLRELSSIDGLTKVRNRASFDQKLQTEWAKTCRSTSPIALILMDVDYFKRFNDTYGHQCGDACLQHIAALLEELTHRAGDYVARYGGEEFCILLCSTPLEGAVQVAERIREAIESSPLEWQGQSLSVTSSFGVASMQPSHTVDASVLITHADEALYAAKEAGRNRVMSYSS